MHSLEVHVSEYLQGLKKIINLFDCNFKDLEWELCPQWWSKSYHGQIYVSSHFILIRAWHLLAAYGPPQSVGPVLVALQMLNTSTYLLKKG